MTTSPHVTHAPPTTRAYLLHLSIYLVAAVALLMAVGSYHAAWNRAGMSSANQEPYNQIEKP